MKKIGEMFKKGKDAIKSGAEKAINVGKDGVEIVKKGAVVVADGAGKAIEASKPVTDFLLDGAIETGKSGAKIAQKVASYPIDFVIWSKDSLQTAFSLLYEKFTEETNEFLNKDDNIKFIADAIYETVPLPVRVAFQRDRFYSIAFKMRDYYIERQEKIEINDDDIELGPRGE